ncbi:MAG TPA: serine/threonine-protein kinase, partial [Nannocystaceae bacterium]|nr:serine/threonine-protein kinase [Nannocystaceae bacterium]
MDTDGHASGPDVTTAHVRETVRAKLFEQPAERVTVGRFVLLERIGEGGMGVVFAAHDPDLDRKVAIKLLHSDDPDRAQRLLREAKAMARLSHPQVVTVYEAGTARGQVYLAMELVRGLDLHRWSAQAKRGWREVLGLLVQAAQGLAAAHDAGLVHRDFKPENVLVTEDGAAKVADFGLAREFGDTRVVDDPSASSGTDPGAGLRTITRGGGIVGTPAYVAPEVIDGHRADARSDQFSFCVTAYEALCGERPFGGDSLPALLDNVVAGRMRPLPQGRRLPGKLRKLLARGLAVDPDARHPSMAALVDAFHRLLGRRRRVVTAIVAVGLVGAAIAIAVPQRLVSCTGAELAWASVWNDDAEAKLRAGLEATGHPAAADTATRVAATIDAYGDTWIAGHRDACEASERGEQSAAMLDQRM